MQRMPVRGGDMQRAHAQPPVGRSVGEGGGVGLFLVSSN